MKKFAINCVISLCYSFLATIGMIVGLGAIGAFMSEHKRIVQNRVKKEWGIPE